MVVEKGIRGGIVPCIKCFATANNVYFEEVYDRESPSSFLT